MPHSLENAFAQYTPLQTFAEGTDLHTRWPHGFGLHLKNRGEKPASLGRIVRELTQETLEAITQLFGCVILDGVHDEGLSTESRRYFPRVTATEYGLDQWHLDAQSLRYDVLTTPLNEAHASRYLKDSSSQYLLVVIYCREQNHPRTIPTLIGDRHVVAQRLFEALKGEPNAYANLSASRDIVSAMPSPTAFDFQCVQTRMGLDTEALQDIFTINALSRPGDYIKNKLHDSITPQMPGVIEVKWRPERAVIFHNMCVAHRRGPNPRDGTEYNQGTLSNYSLVPSIIANDPPDIAKVRSVLGTFCQGDEAILNPKGELASELA